VSFTTPKTWAFGEVLTSTDMNTYVRDNTEELFDRDTDASLLTAGTVSQDRLPVLARQSFRTSTSATETLDFSTGDEVVRSTRAGALTFAGSGYTAGVSKTVVWNGGGTTRTVTFPAGWVFVSVKPTSLLANKRGVLSLVCHGTAESDVTAAWASEA